MICLGVKEPGRGVYQEIPGWWIYSILSCCAVIVVCIPFAVTNLKLSKKLTGRGDITGRLRAPFNMDGWQPEWLNYLTADRLG